MKRRRKINTKKLVEEMFFLILAIVGAVIFICNMTKACPNPNEYVMLSYIIGYGFLIGPALTILSIGAFFEVRG